MRLQAEEPLPPSGHPAIYRRHEGFRDFGCRDFGGQDFGGQDFGGQDFLSDEPAGLTSKP
jgi:hypothetical protein